VVRIEDARRTQVAGVVVARRRVTVVAKKIVVPKKKAVSPKAESPSTQAPRKPRAPRADAAPRPRAKAAAPATPAVRTVTQEEIRVRAYFLSLEHAGQGHDADFWLMAERELTQGHQCD